MSRVIKVEDQVYNDLDKLRVGRQTFSDAIRHLLEVRTEMLQMVTILEGQVQFRGAQREQLERTAPAH